MYIITFSGKLHKYYPIMNINKRPANIENARKLPGNASPGSTKNQNPKLVLLGDQGVGKSSIALQYVRGEFKENSAATVGAAFLTKTVTVANQSIKFDIWDTAGQERYHSLAPMYYRGAHAAVVVYDITNTKTFNKAIHWIKELKNQTKSHMAMVLVGNKADMASDKRAVSREDGNAFAQKNNLIFIESSAKTGMCVGEIFMAIAKLLASHEIPADETEAKGLKLSTNSNDRIRDCHC